MINCSRLSPTTEETRSWQPNNKSTRGLPFNARTALGRSPANRSARSIQRNKPRSASPTGTRQSLSLFHPKEQSSLSLFHWDSAICQALPLGLGNLSASPTGTRQSASLSLWDSTISQPLPLKLGNRLASLNITFPAHQEATDSLRIQQSQLEQEVRQQHLEDAQCQTRPFFRCHPFIRETSTILMVVAPID
ncbi:Uncharacterized protein Adt_22602 [Abeliophyllum distichum]|uniref:Uncharacterized protein n=1 Tax=Abeliophyllum distichum TaxID=126358 RepID=A0ABD1S8G1_9LAMI